MEYKTLTANAIGSLQGKFIAVFQESIEPKPRTRHAILKSDTLEVHGIYEGFDSKKKMQAAILDLEQQFQLSVMAEQKDAFAQLQASLTPASAPQA